jgi:hypothetical protein
MFEKVAQLIGVIIATLIGIEAFFERGYWSAKWGRYIDYGPYHQVIGVIIMVIGLIFAYDATKRIIRGRRNESPSREKV